MPDPLTLGAAAAGAAAAKAGESLGVRLTAVAGSMKRAVVDRAVVAFRLGFETYLTSSYIRCRYFKTVLNPYEPADLKDSYIRLNLISLGSRNEISDKDLFSNFRNGERIVVTGLAGSGKSMLMRYLTLDSFTDLSVGTPLFVELRKINDYEEKDLISFIYNECSQKGKSVTRLQFDLALQHGLFTIILDGFDELEYEYREVISEQIVSFERDYPSLKVIVSSRPDDDRFRSWTSFTIYRVSDFFQGSGSRIN